MSSAALISLEEYLHRAEKPLCEYMDGVLQPKPMPAKLHGLIQFMLVTLLRQQGVEALAEVTVRVSATKFLIPDVIAARTIQSPYPTEPVLLCAEILSPETVWEPRWPSASSTMPGAFPSAGSSMRKSRQRGTITRVANLNAWTVSRPEI
jgi:hypothetical protein